MRAYAQAGAARTTATDDAALVERCGHPVEVFAGSPRNIKVSTPADLALVRALWAEHRDAHDS
jgi:2-C-methyl-D-erythritol 4-phosphate cytidylyltransferase